jgi:hypothetical protein
MKIDKYKVVVEFDLAVMQGFERSDRVALELNGLFNELVKTYVKDKQMMASTTKTSLDTQAQEY